MKPDKGKHEMTVEWLVNRLLPKGYVKIVTHFEYGRGNNLVGECDVLTFRNGLVHYYEVKSNYSPKNYRKAIVQFRRFQEYFHELDIECIYVSPQRVRRANP